MSGEIGQMIHIAIVETMAMGVAKKDGHSWDNISEKMQSAYVKIVMAALAELISSGILHCDFPLKEPIEQTFVTAKLCGMGGSK